MPYYLLKWVLLMQQKQLITPIESMPSPNFLEWLFYSIFPSTLQISIMLSSKEGRNELKKTSKDPNNTFLNAIKPIILKTFGFDGYNPITNIITSADGTIAEYKTLNLPWWIFITSFLGLPNRPSTVINGEPQFSLLQLLRNFIGGWNPLGFFPSSAKQTQVRAVKTVSREKIFWQLLAVPFKFLIILPIKIISIPFKILLNVVKLVTEILFPLISQLILVLSLISIGLTLSLFAWTKIKSPQSSEVSLSIKKLFVAAIPIVLLAIISIAFTIVQYATIWACRIGLAFTSPAESARLAFALGRNLRIGTEGSTLQTTVSNIMGVLGVLTSLALSAVLWSITLPFALSAITTVFPFILSAINWVAQIPFISASLAWISQLPAVTTSLTLLNQLFATVGAGLSIAFGPVITGMASIISVQVPTVVLAVGTTLGMLCTPIIALMSLGAETLSNLWATWTTSGPFSKLIGLFQKNKNISDYHFDKAKDTLYLYESKEGEQSCYVASPFVLNLVSTNKHLSKVTKSNGKAAERLFNDLKANPEKQWKDYRYRFPTPAELEVVSQSEEDDQFESSNDLL